MIDSEKIKAGLKCCLSIGTDNCDECPYSNNCFAHPKDIEEGLLADAIALIDDFQAKSQVDHRSLKNEINLEIWRNK